ncbi:twitching motility protein PilT [Betaproteobacteria bacterium]|nr:twitching motility protein PilT [Betaproteobacteria bacterium]
MKYLLDTHLLIWASESTDRLPSGARGLMFANHELFFSVASLWEIAIKNGRNYPNFRMDARVLRRGLLDNGYHELPILSQHVVDIDNLPPIHKDPFDRLLIAQAMAEGITLLTADATVAQYSGPIQLVR